MEKSSRAILKRQARGTLTGKSVHFLGKDEQGGTEECEAKVQDGTMSGMLIFTDPSDAAHSRHKPNHRHARSATPIRSTAAPPIYSDNFLPPIFRSEQISLDHSPGDSVETTTVDAGGTDEKRRDPRPPRQSRTDPSTSKTAAPGDTLVVHLTRLRLNRDWAVSDDAIVGRGFGH